MNLELLTKYHTLKTKFLDERPFNLKDTGVTSTVINYWTKKKLLIEKKEKDKWREFNLTDLLWIRIIKELRDFRVGIETILEIKEDLMKEVPITEMLNQPEVLEETKKVFEDIKKTNDLTSHISHDVFIQKLVNIRINWLSILLIRMYLQKVNFSFYLIKTPNSKQKFKPLLYCPELIQKEEYDGLEFTSHIAISLNDAISNVIRKNANKLIDLDLLSLSESEKIILGMVREGKWKSIEVKFGKNEEPILIKAKRGKQINPSARLLEIIHNKGYQDIELKTNKGEIVNCIITDKIKLN